MQIARLIGAAGSGKTTELLRIMEGALPKLGNDPLRLGFASFTRAARAEAVGRAAAAWGVSPGTLSGEGWFRTVHSTAKRCIGVQAGQLIGDKPADIEWITNAIGVKVSTSIDEETGRQKFVGGLEGAALNAWDHARNTLLPLDEVVRRARRLDDNVPDYAAVVRIAERYEAAKRIEDRLDFSDLLLRFTGLRVHPTDGVHRVTPEGDLPPVSAWLFDEQQDASPLLDAACKRLVSAESVKWCYVVGDPFQCQPAGTPVLTASGYKPIEDLDGDADSLVAYDTVSGDYVAGCRFIKAWRFAHADEMVRVIFDDRHCIDCTENHKWFVLGGKGFVRTQSYSGSQALRAGDEVPLFGGVSSRVVSIERGHTLADTELNGLPMVRVYSLEVEKHHTYVTTNGIVTGNCIFGFAGSSAECFLGWPAEKEKTMPKSYRCPKPILDLGERCLRRMYRGYFDRGVAPADHEGRVFDTDTEVPLVAARPDEDWLFIARTNFEASRLYASLHAAGKPARWVKQAEGVSVRGQGLAALYALEKGKPVSGAEWGRAVELLPSVNKAKEPMMARGVKTGWAKRHADDWDVIFPNELEKVGATLPLVEKIRSGEWCSLVDRGQEWRRHAERWGADLASNSRIKVGTIHSVKGMEADNVALLTTTSRRVEQSREDCQTQHDEECRVAYVGVTRARRNLYVINEGRRGKPVPRMEVL
jgi:superfamily I DNA/RNA helicase